MLVSQDKDKQTKQSLLLAGRATNLCQKKRNQMKHNQRKMYPELPTLGVQNLSLFLFSFDKLQDDL